MSNYLNRKASAVQKIGILIITICLIASIPIAIGQVSNNSENLNDSELLNNSNNSIETQKTGVDEFGQYAELNESDNLTFFLDKNFDENIEEQNISNESEYSDVPQLSGELLTIEDNQTNQTNFYFEMVDKPNDTQEVSVQLSEIEQGTIFLDLPVNMYQTVTITNTGDEKSTFTINLWDYPEQLPYKYLSESKSIKIYSDDELVSEQPIILTELEPAESKEFTIIYEFEPVHKELNCDTKRISDLLPIDAEIIESDIDVNTVLSKECNVRIYHDGPVHYFDVDVYLDDKDSDNIKSIYYVEGEQYLEVTNNSIVLPE